MTGKFAVESWPKLPWNRGPGCRGIVAQVGLESVAGLPWNTQHENLAVAEDEKMKLKFTPSKTQKHHLKMASSGRK